MTAAAVVIAAIAPMLYSTFSRGTWAKSTKYRGFTFAWPFAVLASVPLIWTDQLSPTLLAAALSIALAIAACSVCLLLRKKRPS